MAARPGEAAGEVLPAVQVSAAARAGQTTAREGGSSPAPAQRAGERLWCQGAAAVGVTALVLAGDGSHSRGQSRHWGSSARISLLSHGLEAHLKAVSKPQGLYLHLHCLPRLSFVLAFHFLQSEGWNSALQGEHSLLRMQCPSQLRTISNCPKEVILLRV